MVSSVQNSVPRRAPEGNDVHCVRVPDCTTCFHQVRVRVARASEHDNESLPYPKCGIDFIYNTGISYLQWPADGGKPDRTQAHGIPRLRIPVRVADAAAFYGHTTPMAQPPCMMKSRISMRRAGGLE